LDPRATTAIHLPLTCCVLFLTLFNCQRTKTDRSRTLYKKNLEPVKGRSDQRENQIEDRRERRVYTPPPSALSSKESIAPNTLRHVQFRFILSLGNLRWIICQCRKNSDSQNDAMRPFISLHAISTSVH